MFEQFLSTVVEFCALDVGDDAPWSVAVRAMLQVVLDLPDILLNVSIKVDDEIQFEGKYQVG